MAKRKKHYRRFPAAAVLAACILVLGSITAVAAYRYLSPAQAAEETGNDLLKEAFLSEDAVLVNESQEDGGISEDDRIYTVVAIEKADGTPMPDGSSDEYMKEAFYVSHYIRGLDPVWYGMMGLGGGYTEFVKDGILYRLIDMDNIEMFADKGIYVGVNTGSFYDTDAYRFDESTGEITRNESYQGVNALFVLPVDKSKADPAAAQAFLKECEQSFNEPSEPIEMDERQMEVEEFINMLTSDNLEEYCEMDESTRQVCTPDGDGYISFGNGGHAPVDFVCPDRKAGVRNIGSYSCSDGVVDLNIEVFTLNEDGTVTYAMYHPKQ